MVVNPYLGD